MTAALVEIVLVEDDPRDAELTLHALQRRNVTNPVRVVTDGQDALVLLLGAGEPAPGRLEPPRIVLLDLRLPSVDGLEILRRLRAHPRTEALPVVVMTSSQDEQDLIESLRLGVSAYVVKPIDFTQLAEVVIRLGLFWTLLSEPPPARLSA